MLLHANAKTTPQLRLELVERIDIGESVQEVARAIGISRTTTYKWRRRFKVEGPSGLLGPKQRAEDLPSSHGASEGG